MESHYRINVALNGQHFFATSNSIHTENHMKAVYSELAKKFTRPEGYEISVTYWEGLGRRIDMQELCPEAYILQKL